MKFNLLTTLGITVLCSILYSNFDEISIRYHEQIEIEKERVSFYYEDYNL
jgi:hypothetical protein